MVQGNQLDYKWASQLYPCGPLFHHRLLQTLLHDRILFHSLEDISVAGFGMSAKFDDSERCLRYQPLYREIVLVDGISSRPKDRKLILIWKQQLCEDIQ